MLSMVLLAAGIARGQTWRAPGFAMRAIVVIEKAGSNGGEPVDTAILRVEHGGATREDANDYRIFDASGAAIPYEVSFHDAKRDTLLSFRCGAVGGRYEVYFGKADAARDPMRTSDPTIDGKPVSAGPGANGWTPHAGLILTTMRRPREMENPMSTAQMADLIAQSPGPDGADVVQNISHGLNPFGDSDYYISVYRGYLRIDKAGDYGLCTASNEASFSFMDGADLVHWPGRHTEQRGKYGEFNTHRTLSPGMHYVTYLHEEVLLYQTAFLGWRPPGAVRFDKIPESMWAIAATANVARYETPAGRTVMLHVRMIDSVWPSDEATGQYTRYRFTADAGGDADDEAWRVAWDFGDGVTGTGTPIDHVYLANGDYTVKMHAATKNGREAARTWPVRVFAVEHLEGPFKAGRIEKYAPIVKTYDPVRLDAPGLSALLVFWSQANDPASGERAAKLMLARSDISPSDQAAAHRAIVGAAGAAEHAWDASLTPLQTTDAIKHLDAAVALTDDLAKKVMLMARVIRLAGIDAADSNKSGETYAAAESLAKQNGGRGHMSGALRAAAMAMGDANLAANKLDAAARMYEKAEQLADPVVPSSVRAAKIGAYPEIIERALADKDIDTAQDTVREWLDWFPSDQLHGASLFYLGKVQQANGQAATSIKPLKLAIELAPGAEFEAEARYRYAAALKSKGDTAGATSALRALIDAGLPGPYRDKAMAALKEAAK
ncbi:MAG: PKD domain-containing protein [Planctomycetes bacterium]|nr:PKD domain-containing protein [Planctomycetota bacterium]